MNKCGILCPISILPNKYGIGSFGKCSYDLIDFLVECKQSYLQILPLGQTGFGDSPYQTFSFYAGSIYYIDLQFLINDGLLLQSDVSENDSKLIDYNFLYKSRIPLLKKAFLNFVINEDYNDFISNHWLEDYSMFMSLKEVFNCSWYELPINYKYRDKNSLDEFKENYIDLINFYKFTQYLFYKQWSNLKSYANKNNIKIIGDIPIYASYDSCDVWCNPSNFDFDEFLNPKYVSGCSSDEFCIEGQYWGNPIYNWEYIKGNNFDLFKKRFDYNLKMYDVVRVDHFRGYSSYFKIKYNCSPLTGVWCDAYGVDLFDTLNLDKNKIIIEDLGYITKDVIDLVKHTNFSNMRVSVFGLDNKSIHLPKNYNNNCVAYSSTHDNVPIKGWYKNLNDSDRKFIDKYYNGEICFSVIKHLYKSDAKLVIIAIQDLLQLAEEATFNKPNTLNNWTYRLDNNYLNSSFKNKLINLVIKYNR